MPSDQLYLVPVQPSVTIGDSSATVIGAALAPGSAGLYQVSVRIPTSLADGDQPIVLTQAGYSSPNAVYLTVKR